MRSVDEQMKEIQKRESALRDKHRSHRVALLSGLSCAACICLIVAAVTITPALGGQSDASVPVYYGTVLLGSPVAGVAVIVLLSFALGVSVTLLCAALRRKKGGK